MPNTLYYGDNLPILRQHVADESVDLVYLDPPFNSNRSYNVLFKDEGGQESAAQIEAFADAWHWDAVAERTYQELVTEAPAHVGQMIGALRQFIGSNQMMAYLVMMAARLVELHRVLKETGSLYLHCDPTASHYLKVLMDAVFGATTFLNEIIWYYRGAGVPHDARAHRHDVLLHYAKSAGKQYFDPDPIRRPYAQATTERFSHYIGNVRGGRDFGVQKLNPKGKHPDDVIIDIQPIAPSARARLGYPTQKPEELLTEVIAASSREGDIVLDPFCGCGTAIVVAERLKRRWIGIDITHLAISLIRYRLESSFPGIQFETVGEPEDLGSARQLAQDDPYQFQWWALSLLRAKPLGGQVGSKKGKKGADRGIDGVINFIDDASGKPKRVLVQVKGGGVKSGDIRDLHGVIDREQAAIGVFVTLEPPSGPMKTEAVSAGFYHSPGWNQDYPRLQILTIAELLAGAKVAMPPAHGTFREAPRAQQEDGQQMELGM